MKRIFNVLRILFGLLLLVYLFSRINLRLVVNHMVGADVKFFLLACIPYLFFILLSAWRWKILLDYKELGVSFSTVLKIYFIHLFVNNFLPTTVGGDVVRVAYTMKEQRRAEALASVLVDRVIGFLGLFIFAFFSVLLLYITLKKVEFLAFLIVGFAVLLVISTVMFSERLYRLLSPLLLRIRLLRLGERLTRLYETFVHYGKGRMPMVYCIILSFFIQALLAYAPYLILQALPTKFNISYLSFFIYIPMINVLTMIPVSVGGIGVRESSYVFLFKRANLPADAAVSVSLLYYFFTFLFSLPGAVLFIIYRRKAKV